MKNNRLQFILSFVSFVSIVGLTGCSKKVIYSDPATLIEENITRPSNEKQMAYAFVTSSKNDNSVFENLSAPNFYSHDQNWGGEKEAFITKRNSDNSFTQMKPVRILQDDSLVAIQSRVLGDTLRFRWDIFRFEEEKIQEHWSNMYDSIGLNPDGHTEIDGPTIPTQFDKTDTNRAHVRQFMDQCMIREAGGAPKFFNFKLYIQHNREVGDGLGGLLLAMRRMKKAGKIIKFKNNYHVIAEGNLVLSATEGYTGGEKMVFYDLFRIENSKIVEHWDIISPTKEFIYHKENE